MLVLARTAQEEDSAQPCLEVEVEACRLFPGVKGPSILSWTGDDRIPLLFFLLLLPRPLLPLLLLSLLLLLLYYLY